MTGYRDRLQRRFPAIKTREPLGDRGCGAVILLRFADHGHGGVLRTLPGSAAFKSAGADGYAPEQSAPAGRKLRDKHELGKELQ